LPVDGVPLGIASGPDATVWITSGRTHMFFRVTADGAIQGLKAGPDTYPGFIVAGPDHSLWFTEPSGKIGRLTPPASITEFALPEPNEESTQPVRTSDARDAANRS
jgi:virginiamycin B lyase